MSGYLFIFGNTPRFSQAELSVFFPNHHLVSPDVAGVDDDLDAMVWMKRLGGTVKIAKVIGEYDSISSENIAALLKKNGNRTFGLSSYTKKFPITPPFLHDVKKLLVSARFVLPKGRGALSSVVVAKEKLIELVIVEDGGTWLVGQTVAVQDFEEWNRRDYGRPAVDPKAGMLPPKVARMAVNLVELKVERRKSKVMLDPFCGMGTILGEALLVGWNVLGSDISEDAINKARKNLEWLNKPNWKLMVSDATHISEKIPQESVDAIVTEPYMGEANTNAKNVIKGLEKLYIGCLKDWQKVLKPGGKVVIALPEYAIAGRTFFVKSVIDRCESLGYTLLAGPIAYSRPHAIVRRMFYIFQKF